MTYIYFIMPVGSDPQYKRKRELLRRVSEDTGRNFFFPLERQNSFSFDATRTHLTNASLVIADLSLERPSCYFELGMALALGTPVCMIAATGTVLHQTATSEPVLFYSDLDEYSAIVSRAVSSLHQTSR